MNTGMYNTIKGATNPVIAMSAVQIAERAGTAQSTTRIYLREMVERGEVTVEGKPAMYKLVEVEVAEPEEKPVARKRPRRCPGSGQPVAEAFGTGEVKCSHCEAALTPVKSGDVYSMRAHLPKGAWTE